MCAGESVAVDFVGHSSIKLGTFKKKKETV